MLLPFGVLLMLAVGSYGLANRSARSTCWRSICLEIEGRGPEVERWRTTGSYDGRFRCVEATFLRGGETLEVIPVCGAGTLSATVSDLVIDDRTQLCAAWSDLPGRPCLVVRP